MPARDPIKPFFLCLTACAVLSGLAASAEDDGQRQADAQDTPAQSGDSANFANSSNSSDSSGGNMEPVGEIQPSEIQPSEIPPSEIPPGETQATESPEAQANTGLPEAPPAELPSGQPSQEASEASPTGQAKGKEQLIESLRDVFPINGNPLKDLFTPQPQYVTPQTLMNPQPKAPFAGEANPLKGLFTPQPQYVTPQTLMNPEPSPPGGEINHFKGMFTAQPQYPTSQTLMNPHALPRYYVKERLPEHFFEKAVNGKGADGQKAETPLGPAKSTDANTAGSAHPLRQALLLLNSGREQDAIRLINRMLVQTPGNFQARYVRAVALVRLRRFAEASEEYKTILRFSPDLALRKLAQEGITKLGV